MHPSWLFPGASQGPGQTADAASGDRPNDSSVTSFPINSFVRSLNLRGVRLPGGFPFKGVVTDNDEDKRESKNPKADKAADLNDLINLVSTTAKEFRDINAGTAKTESTARTIDPRCTKSPVNPPDIGTSTLVRPEIRARKNEGSCDFLVPDSATQKCDSSRGPSRTAVAPDGTYPSKNGVAVQSRVYWDPLLRKRRNKKDPHDSPSTDEFFTPPELVEIYSENQSRGVKRANLSAESLETLGYFETPRCFLPEVLRLARAVGFADASSINGDRNRSMAPSANGRRAFSPYFTGTPSKASWLGAADRNFIDDTETSTNSSRSSPIFSGAGEAPAEPLEIVVPTRDREDHSKRFEKSEIVSGNSGDRLISEPIPIEVDERDINSKKIVTEEGKREPRMVDTNVHPYISKEVELASDTNEDKVEREARANIPTKHHKMLHERSKKNDRKKNSVESDDEDTCDESRGSTSQSPMTSARKSTLQRFPEASGTVESDEEMTTGSVKGIDSVETQMEICAKADNHLRANERKADPKKMTIAELPVRCNVSTENQEPSEAICKRSSSVETNRSAASSKTLGGTRNIRQKGRVSDSSQPVWKPGGNAKVVSSTSSSSMPGRSKIARSMPRIRPNTAETSKGKENTEATSKSKVPAIRKYRSRDIIAESEATVKTPRSRSKQRPGTPKTTSGYVRCDAKSVPRDKDAGSSSCRNETAESSKCTHSNLKTTIPVLRSKTFVHRMRKEPTVRRVASEEDRATNPKSTSIGSSRDALTPGPANKIFGKPPNDCRAAPKRVNMDFSSNDSIAVNEDPPKKDLAQSPISSEEKTRKPSSTRKFLNKDADDTLRMIKSVLLHQEVSVEGANKSAGELRSVISRESEKKSKIPSPGLEKSSAVSRNDRGNAGSLRESKTLFEKLAVLAESSPDRTKPGRRDSRERSVSSFADRASESTTSHARSVRDEERCFLPSESSDVSQRSLRSREFSEFRKFREARELVSDVSTEIDDDYRRTIYVDAGVSPTPSEIDRKYFEVAETQTCVKVADKNSATEEIVQRATKCIDTDTDALFVSSPEIRVTMLDKDSATEEIIQTPAKYIDANTGTRLIDSASKDCRKPENVAETQTRVNLLDKDSATEEITQTASKYIDANTGTHLIASASKDVGTDLQKPENVAETQTRVNLLDKDTATEESIQPAMCINVDTETRSIDSVSKETDTDFLRPENVDATSQIDPGANSRNTASGNDFAGIDRPSRETNTERPDLFSKSRGVCFGGPRKIDESSQFDPTGKSKDTASGRNYVESRSVTEGVNTDRQDYLFEDRSVDVLRSTTVEEGCQVDPAPVKIAHAAVGEFSLDAKSSSEDILLPMLPHDRRSIETLVVKDTDVVQWQSSTTLDTSMINRESSCSSSSSLVARRPEYSQRSSAEKFGAPGDRVPKQAIVALEMASERAQNLCKAIGIYRQNLAMKEAKPLDFRSDESVEKDQPIFDRRINEKSTARSEKHCGFRENSKMKSLFEANLKSLHSETSNLPQPEQSERYSESEEVREEITSLIDDLLTNVVEVIKSKSECRACVDIDKSHLMDKEHFVYPKKRRSLIELTEVLEERNINEEQSRSKSGRTSEFIFFSRNSLLTLIYGTVCSLVFWALQFSITCDSV